MNWNSGSMTVAAAQADIKVSGWLFPNINVANLRNVEGVALKCTSSNYLMTCRDASGDNTVVFKQH